MVDSTSQETRVEEVLPTALIASTGLGDESPRDFPASRLNNSPLGENFVSTGLGDDTPRDFPGSRLANSPLDENFVFSLDNLRRNGENDAPGERKEPIDGTYSSEKRVSSSLPAGEQHGSSSVPVGEQHGSFSVDSNPEEERRMHHTTTWPAYLIPMGSWSIV